MKFSKEHLLEWTTAEEAEKKNDKDLKSMYKMMFPNVILGILGIVFLEIANLRSNIRNNYSYNLMYLDFNTFYHV